ncbi:MAG: D-aminoacyl-tRNA deacylase [Candidatus Binatia bacterium]
MRAVVQRVAEARVSVDDEVVGAIGRGLCVLVGVAAADTPADADYLCRKVTGLRIFQDDAGRFAHSVEEVGGALLLVSQFTLYGDCRRGRRPSFTDAAPAEQARALFERFVDVARSGPVPVATGRFQAHMAVHLVNDGPVTILLDSREAA